jgi:leucine dehydrogenase
VLDEVIRSWDGEQVVVRFDHATETWIFICVHSTSRGPAGGGTRMKTYATPAAALEDATRLAGAMTLKMAGIDVPFGGGKAVLAVPRPLADRERRGLLLRYGRLIDSLGGTYRTGPDVNTTVDDMDVIAESTPYVFCRSVERGGSGDPGPYTARGVFHGIRASVGYAFGSDELSERSVLVQGVGDVGARLAEQLAEAGARVLVSDIDADRGRHVADGIGAETVTPDAALSTECDVYAPCALGATLNDTSVPRLRCRIVAGSANNQLAEAKDAERLRSAGVLYAPDFVINAGGVIHAWGTEGLGWTPEQVEARLAGLGDELLGIYARADDEGITTAEAAERIARARIG